MTYFRINIKEPHRGEADFYEHGTTIGRRKDDGVESFVVTDRHRP